mmetsp:Transcript_22041/g.39083  ORF Transcript_22041/g.39083 Transcript_22041/m.39083 type:complete len:169 (+) Transcript_22041:31-537(+)
MGGEKKKGEVDLYRDTYVRYFGYANELGEAFRPLVPAALVWGSYGVSSIYVLADTYDKVGKTQQKFSSYPPRRQQAEMFQAGVDTCLWQAFASVIIPGFTIHSIVGWTKKAVTSVKAPKAAVVAVPTAVGLGAIPLIIHPIDSFVDWAMDNTLRKAFEPIKSWWAGSK